MTVIRAAKEEIERRAAGRFKQERKEYEEKMAARAKQEEETGKKPRGKAPVEPTNSAPNAKDQVNLTDDESRIMRESGGGFEQSYNAQASVDEESKIVVTLDVTNNVNDKKELVPALESIENLPEELPEVKRIVADAGYYSESNVDACEEADITPFIAPGRMPHNRDFAEECTEPETAGTNTGTEAGAASTGTEPGTADIGTEPGSGTADIDTEPGSGTAGTDTGPKKGAAGTAVERMKRRLKTKEGRKIFSRRKCTIEPVFGIIKHIMGFRQFLLRGLESVRGEWRLVCMSWNIKRLHKMMNEKGLQLI
jgi:IS5 family transposase